MTFNAPLFLLLAGLCMLPGLQAQPAPLASQAGVRTPDALPTLRSQAEFDALARVHNPGTALALPHVMFAIDRLPVPARMHYLNTPRFGLHEHFVRRTGLMPRADAQAIKSNYLRPDRRFLFGTVSWQPDMASFTYEFWEGDQLTEPLLRQADQLLKASFFAPLQLKTSSTLHERLAQKTGLAFVTQEALIRQQPFMALNPGVAIGRLRIVEKADDADTLRPDDIAVLRQVPLSLAPVSGVVTERASTVLSHVNLLAKGWGIPNAYLRDAAGLLRAQAGQWVELKVAASGYQLRRLTASEIAAWQLRQKQASPQKVVSVAKPDLGETRLWPLVALRPRHSAQCGAKAANLGVLQLAGIAGTFVPDGFCIPFSQYDRFMRAHRLADRLAQMQQMPGFKTDPKIRKEALARLRGEIVQWPLDRPTAADWQARWQAQLGGGGVFVRSSSNSEDLPGFSGAGLYTTVPNVLTGEALERAVKTVWASVFNFEAWEARSAARFAADAVMMGVFVQSAIDAANAGVMITRDPFSPAGWHVTYISAKRGIGIRVVEGQRVAEQVMYSSWSKAIQVLSRSADDTALQLDPAGGVRQVPVAVGRVVLNDALVLRLADVGAGVKQVFGGVDQDIEWATVGEHIALLQARPYVDRSTAPPRP
ncbi:MULTISPECIES: PEP/pyruvate-binding domain-containing protein [unclassified Polaromonas]|uniref:PEP/pyruvate-binding domain-containing protein n=1 Tax=unclassified Polaromonas TaxID=2638319 RepID=UPI001A33B91A|nr:MULTISPECIES: PEP/pyruvate-binding domain-containing protein [unclassified Polaromonas]MBG6072380.1 heme-degrading monooxygenase HmoA [Polaromonas sp. CG_9.7]MBG6114189.1 heme-degrading monooxygenase HmoA [Polaromonas sp. CG_9.2]MDH6182854.1 heme-degrading monooxygenase HmoA [Polaromonas sp. CG_23.6]